jgi:hypothetical protein
VGRRVWGRQSSPERDPRNTRGNMRCGEHEQTDVMNRDGNPYHLAAQYYQHVRVASTAFATSTKLIKSSTVLIKK